MREFSLEETEAFRLACRKNNCTIQAAAQIAGTIAIGRASLPPTLAEEVIFSVVSVYCLSGLIKMNQ